MRGNRFYSTWTERKKDGAGTLEALCLAGPRFWGGAQARQHPSSHKGIPATHRRGGWRRKPQLAAARSPEGAL